MEAFGAAASLERKIRSQAKAGRVIGDAGRKRVSRALVGERQGTPLGLVSHFPPGAELRASEGSLCAQWRWKGIQITHWNFQPTRVGWGGVEMPWMFREQLLRGFRVWKKWVSILPC